MFLKLFLTYLLFLKFLRTSSGLLHGSSGSIVNSVTATPQSTLGIHGNSILGSLVVELDKRVNDLILRVHALEIERQDYANKNIQLEQLAQEQKIKIASLQNNIVTLEGRVKTLESNQGFLTHNMTALEEVVSVIEDNVVKNCTINQENITNQLQVLSGLKVQTRYVSLALLDVQTDTGRLNVTLMNLIEQNKRIIGNMATPKLGFTAYLGADKPLSTGSTVVFSHVYSNVGLLYNSQNGVFTADRDGLYAFYSGIECHRQGQIYADLLKDGSIIARASCRVEISDTAIAYESLFSIQYLSKDSQVWVKIHNFNSLNSQLTAGGKTCFSGFLV